MIVIKKIYLAIVMAGYLLKTIAVSTISKNKVFILNTPIHGNLGDQAILDAEEQLLNDALGPCTIIEIEKAVYDRFPKLVKKIIKNSPVCIQGGGYIGDLWPSEDETIRNIINDTSDNKVLFFPQTICCNNYDKYFSDMKNLLESNKNITFFARDRHTFSILSEKVNGKILYSPDIVLYNSRNNYDKEKKITLCLRADREKTIDNKIEQELLSAMKNYSYEMCDTVIDRPVFRHNRKTKLKKLFNKIGTSELLITDRLHGMIIAYLTKTPCLVFNSKSPKLLGTFEWIKKSDYIKMHNDDADINEEIESILSHKFNFNESVSEKSFEKIINVVRSYYK